MTEKRSCNSMSPLHLAQRASGPRSLAPSLICRFVVSLVVMMIVMAVAAACTLPRPVRFDDSGLHVRPASKELLDQAQSTIEKIQSRAERLSNRAAKAEDLNGKSDS